MLRAASCPSSGPPSLLKLPGNFSPQSPAPSRNRRNPPLPWRAPAQTRPCLEGGCPTSLGAAALAPAAPGIRAPGGAVHERISSAKRALEHRLQKPRAAPACRPVTPRAGPPNSQPFLLSAAKLCRCSFSFYADSTQRGTRRRRRG